MASLYSRASPLPVRLAVRISLAPPSRQTAVTVECRTARAQDQHGLARKIYTVGPGQIGKAA